MPLYESVVIARQDVSSQQVESLSEEMQGLVQQHGGKIEKSEYWGLRNLAYRIKKNRKGHYLMMHLDAPAEALQELERSVHINEDIIRFLAIRVDEFEEGPSIMMQTRSAREGARRERGDRGDRGDRSERGAPRERGEPAKNDASEAAPSEKES